jgi:excisionase family DNA binding protein
VLADDHELTTAEAGELLGLSRTFIVRLIGEGVIPAHYAGTHRRLRTSDVLAYARQRQERLDSVAAIAHSDVAIGIPYR